MNNLKLHKGVNELKSFGTPCYNRTFSMNEYPLLNILKVSKEPNFTEQCVLKTVRVISLSFYVMIKSFFEI